MTIATPREIANAALAARRVCFLITTAPFVVGYADDPSTADAPRGHGALNASSATNTTADSAITQIDAPSTPESR